MTLKGFPSGSEVKVSACNAGDLSLIPGLGRSPGEGNGNPLQYSCLENPMDGGAWWFTVHGITKGQTRLSDFTSSHHHVTLQTTSSTMLPLSNIWGDGIERMNETSKEKFLLMTLGIT